MPDRHPQNGALAHLVLRLALGVNLLVHGLVRLPELDAFADGLVHLDRFSVDALRARRAVQLPTGGSR